MADCVALCEATTKVRTATAIHLLRAVRSSRHSGMKAVWMAALLLLPVTLLAGESNTVYVIEIREDITHNTLFLIRRGVNEAAAKNASAIVLDMETNGGRVDVTEDIIQVLQHSPVKTYTYVNPKAFSAGAYIAAATDKIFMAPGSVIGAATPIVLTPGEGVANLPAAVQEKMTSAMRGLIRATAQQKGHNPDVFEAMVDADKGLTIDGKEISPKGKLLTVTADEAVKIYGMPAKPLLSAGTVKTLDDLLAKIGLAGATVERVKPYGFEVAARWITMLSPLLILVGMVAIYLELKAPGLGVPTMVAVICFGVYFLGFFVAGLAGWEEAALFVVGLLLVAFEVIFPGHLLSGIAGTILILAALMMAMIEKFPGGPAWPGLPALEIPILRVLGGFVGSVVVMIILGRYLPKSSFFRRMELVAATNTAEGYTTAAGEAKSLLGTTGVAETNLRPSGKGRFGEQLVDVVTEGDLIERGSKIKITEVQGARVVVEKA
jgi:membrane-bound serine protease (ClpP class)